MPDVKSYIKNPPFGDFSGWVEREFEAIERGLEDAAYGLRWDDLRAPASTINPAGSIAPATVDTTDGTLIFQDNADKIAAVVMQMPHAWKQGSSIRPHIHVQFKTGATAPNNVSRWKLEWDIAAVNGDFGGFTAGKSETINCTNPNNVNKHCIFSFSDIAMTGYTWSTILKFKISRLANTDAADTNEADVNLLEFDVHYQSDGRGSIPEYPI